MNAGGPIHRPGVQIRCNAFNTSAIAAAFFISQMPPARPKAGCRISAAPARSIAAQSDVVVIRSPVATGMRRLRAP